MIQWNLEFFNKLGTSLKKVVKYIWPTAERETDKQTKVSDQKHNRPLLLLHWVPVLCDVVCLNVIPELHLKCCLLLTTIFIAMKWRLCYVKQYSPFSPSPILLNIKH